MEKVWYSVIFFIIINQVFAFGHACSSLESIQSCNECIRCHGTWCNDPDELSRCVAAADDDWCPMDKEWVHSIRPEEVPGKFFSRRYRAKSVRAWRDEYQVTYRSNTELQIKFDSNSTQEPVQPDISTSCEGGVCTITVQSEVDTGFCRQDGRVEEFYTFSLKVNVSDEELVMKNHVPCACTCSEHVDRKSSRCSGRGDWACGDCTCEAGWHGVNCEQQDVKEEGPAKTAAPEPAKTAAPEPATTAAPKPASSECSDHGVLVGGQCQCDEPWFGMICQLRDTRLDYTRCNGHGMWNGVMCQCYGFWSGKYCDKCTVRGDIACNSDSTDNVGDCSGHGTCDCGCLCHNNTIGFQYFDHHNYCEDLCSTISNCDTCVFQTEPGRCAECTKFSLIREPYVESRLEEVDELNRRMWVTCNETLDECTTEYAAMRKHTGETIIMIIKSCGQAESAAYVSVTVPVLLGILLPLLAVLTVAAFYVWKNRTPSLPLTDPKYQNINAEVCTGENPLYKPPTSSFKNPTYGKWQ